MQLFYCPPRVSGSQLTNYYSSIRMNNKEIALLGLLTAGPKYGYQLENDIEARGMREWTEIGFSSIYYLLNKSEARGWVVSTLGESSKGPVRKLYALTEGGWGQLRQEVARLLSAPRHVHPAPGAGHAGPPPIPAKP